MSGKYAMLGAYADAVRERGVLCGFISWVGRSDQYVVFLPSLTEVCSSIGCRTSISYLPTSG